MTEIWPLFNWYYYWRDFPEIWYTTCGISNLFSQILNSWHYSRGKGHPPHTHFLGLFSDGALPLECASEQTQYTVVKGLLSGLQFQKLTCAASICWFWLNLFYLVKKHLQKWYPGKSHHWGPFYFFFLNAKGYFSCEIWYDVQLLKSLLSLYALDKVNHAMLVMAWCPKCNKVFIFKTKFV